MGVDLAEIELAGEEEDDGADGGEVAISRYGKGSSKANPLHSASNECYRGP